MVRGLPAAVASLSHGARARVLFVDLDGAACPAGAIHELAAVCEGGTVAVALGSDGSVRFAPRRAVLGLRHCLPSARQVARSAALTSMRRGRAPQGVASGRFSDSCASLRSFG